MNKEKNGTILLCAIAALLLTACEGDDGAVGPTGPAGPAGEPGDNAVQQSITLTFLGRARNPDSGFDEGAAEIVTYEPASQQLFVVNAQSGDVDVFSMAAPGTPALTATLDVAADVTAAVRAAGNLGSANSIDVDAASNTLAVAIGADPEQDPGYVAFYQASDGTFLPASPISGRSASRVIASRAMRSTAPTTTASSISEIGRCTVCCYLTPSRATRSPARPIS